MDRDGGGAEGGGGILKKKVAVGEERWKREEKDNEVEC